MRQDAPRHVPRWRDARRAMADGITLFGFRSATGLIATGNVLLGGALLATPVLAAFGAADRLVRAAIGTLHPLSQVVLPRVAAQRAAGGSAAALLARSMRVTGGLGLLIGVVTFVAAPFIVAILLGPGYESAIPFLRALALLPPLVAVNTVLGVQWAIPFGRDRAFLGAVLVSGSVNFALAILLAPGYGAMGIIVALVGAEALQTALLLRERRRFV
jgi:PST family polysaccharide transporter